MGNPSKVLLFGSLTEEDTLVVMNQIKLNEIKLEEKKQPTEEEVAVNQIKLDQKKQPKLSSSSPVASYPKAAPKNNKVSGSKVLVRPTEKGRIQNSTNSHSNGIKSNGRINSSSSSSKPLNNGIKSNGSSSSGALNNNGNKSKALNNGKKSNSTISRSSSSGSLNREYQYREYQYHSKRNMSALSVMQDMTPRGLVNKGNLCFLSATLQALLACSPFVHLLKGLILLNLPKDVYPTLSAFAEFICKFHVPEGIELNKKDAKSLDKRAPFSPTYIFEGVLRKFTPEVPNPNSGLPRQKDAQEFLSFIMQEMHDEFLKLKGQDQSHLDAADVADVEWETVGRKNKSVGTRTDTFVTSELSSIFGGQLRSAVNTKDNKPAAAATVEPFMLLHLDVSHEDVRTIWDALQLFSAPESFKAEVVTTTHKTIKFFSLPKVLILHLSYNSQENKLCKNVYFPLELQLTNDLLHVSSLSKGRRYELVSAVRYRGEAGIGRYVADVRQANGEWLRFDNTVVTAISTEIVLREQAYVLFYEQL